MPELTEMEKLRTNRDIYVTFCYKFLPCVIGNQVFKNGCCTSSIESIATVSDEAMAFLILSNNWEPWLQMMKTPKTNDHSKGLEDCGIKQKYFKESKGRGHSWSDQGKRYFNHMYDKIALDRKENGSSFNVYFKNRMLKDSEQGKRLEMLESRKKKVKTDYIEVRNDFDFSMFGNKQTDRSYASSKYISTSDTYVTNDHINNDTEDQDHVSRKEIEPQDEIEDMSQTEVQAKRLGAKQVVKNL